MRQRPTSRNRCGQVVINVAPEPPIAAKGWRFVIAPKKNNAISALMHSFLGIEYSVKNRDSSHSGQIVPTISINFAEPNPVGQLYRKTDDFNRLAQVSKLGQKRLNFVSHTEITSQNRFGPFPFQYHTVNFIKMFLWFFLTPMPVVLILLPFRQDFSTPPAPGLCADACAKPILMNNNIYCRSHSEPDARPNILTSQFCDALARGVLLKIKKICGVDYYTPPGDDYLCNQLEQDTDNILAFAFGVGILAAVTYFLYFGDRWQNIKIQSEDPPDEEITLDTAYDTTVHQLTAGSGLFNLTQTNGQQIRRSNIYTYVDPHGEPKIADDIDSLAVALGSAANQIR
ncbi:MAG: hypothetical protein P1U63_11665 [Coxiellaceae bacterium]|nr:hypothetical protein [Coxiellaceae bacterium]